VGAEVGHGPAGPGELGEQLGEVLRRHEAADRAGADGALGPGGVVDLDLAAVALQPGVGARVAEDLAAEQVGQEGRAAVGAPLGGRAVGARLAAHADGLVAAGVTVGGGGGGALGGEAGGLALLERDPLELLQLRLGAVDGLAGGGTVGQEAGELRVFLGGEVGAVGALGAVDERLDRLAGGLAALASGVEVAVGLREQVVDGCHQGKSLGCVRGVRTGTRPTAL
jgi:hypothetical protein